MENGHSIFQECILGSTKCCQLQRTSSPWTLDKELCWGQMKNGRRILQKFILISSKCRHLQRTSSLWIPDLCPWTPLRQAPRPFYKLTLPQGRRQEFWRGSRWVKGEFMNFLWGANQVEVEGKARIEGAKRPRGPENRGRSPNRWRKAPENWGWSPNRGQSSRKKRGGSGEGARWAPPKKFFEKSNFKQFILVHIWGEHLK